MGSISKIRYTNVVYENGGKRYNDEIFTCAGHNTAILLENGGGKTVFIQAALQAILPHTDLGDRKAKETFVLEGGAAHIAIEWIISDKPRRYGLTAVTLYTKNNELKSYKYAYEYGVEDKETIEDLPFTIEEESGKRAATRVEMQGYYQKMSKEHLQAKNFATTKDFHYYIEEYFKIIPDEWRSVTVINGGEGSVEAFFDGCKTTSDLVDKLLLPTVEQGLVGEGSSEFAGTFESQREHFNKHKQLERSIRESEKIKTEIQNYVTDFSRYNECVQAYAFKKREGKALWQLIERKEKEVEQKLLQFESEKKELESKKRGLQKDLDYMEVAESKNRFIHTEKLYEKKHTLYEEIKARRSEKETRRHVLKLSRFQKNMNEAQSKIKLYEEQLSVLDGDTEVEALHEALEEINGQIKGYFEERLEEIKRELIHLQREKDNYLETKLEKEKEKDIKNEQIQKKRAESSKLLGKLEHQERQLTKLKMHMVAQGATEDIEGQEVRWRLRKEEIDGHKHKIKENLRVLEESTLHLTLELEEASQKQMHNLAELGRVQVQLEQLEEAHNKIIVLLQESSPLFENLASIYLKPKQVITTLEEQLERLSFEKEEALAVERKHTYFLENYEARDFFTVEPLLELWVEKWQNDFTYIQTGTAFVASIEDSELQKQMYTQPQWAQIVVVEDGEVQKLLDYLKQHAIKMTYPVSVLSASEARGMSLEEVQSNIIYPTTWAMNMQGYIFETHKQEASKALEEARLYRKQKEKALRDIGQVLDKVNGFLELYSHEKHADLRQLSDALKKQEDVIVSTVDNAKQRLAEEQKEIRLLNETLRKEEIEKNTIQQALEKALEYLAVQKEYTKEVGRIKLIKENLEREETELNQIANDYNDAIEALEEAKENYNYQKSEENRIQDDVLYKEVKEEKACSPEHDMVYLRAKREALKDTVSNKQKGRREIENLLNHSQNMYEENEKSYKQEAAEHEMLHVEIPSYHDGLGVEMDRLADELIQLKKQLIQEEEDVQSIKTQYDKKEHEYVGKKEQYEAQYGKVENWQSYTDEDKVLLLKQSESMAEKEKFLGKTVSGLEKELKFILESKQQMDKKDELFHYCAPDVVAGVLEEHIEQEFVYELKVRVIVNSLLENLEQLRQEVEDGKKQIEERQMHFKLFCQREIRDSKLRGMAVQGITQKQTYNDLVVWKDNIVQRINHTLAILERDLVDQDQQIAQFIIHLYAYLKTVVAELSEIPKNTSVHTEEGWKTIFEFSIPSWQEESGKEKIRGHIYSLLDTIEGNSFLDDTGNEDLTKIKKYIKEQFKLRNLLKVVMGNDVIRVRCRKVSNMNDISTQKYSWETSNKWSGGEKWSKNMALYLGILNYLAEKKQKIQNENQKVSRCVILDNPFGKASSGHVLEPVFFIAKQLGFQIIALTAHSEGDFIRRYFPIVYSCKLRSTIDQKTSIFTKEQEIKKAYFMDNDPVALSILGSNQLTLLL